MDDLCTIVRGATGNYTTWYNRTCREKIALEKHISLLVSAPLAAVYATQEVNSSPSCTQQMTSALCMHARQAQDKSDCSFKEVTLNSRLRRYDHLSRVSGAPFCNSAKFGEETKKNSLFCCALHV